MSAIPEGGHDPNGEPLVIGAYTLTPLANGDVWIAYASGEGGAFKVSDLERALTQFWREHF